MVGYELLVGGGALGPRPLGEAGTTAAMLLDVFGDVGVDRLAGRHPAWVTITPAFLLEVGTPPVRPDRVVLQIARGAGARRGADRAAAPALERLHGRADRLRRARGAGRAPRRGEHRQGHGRGALRRRAARRRARAVQARPEAGGEPGRDAGGGRALRGARLQPLPGRLLRQAEPGAPAAGRHRRDRVACARSPRSRRPTPPSRTSSRRSARTSACSLKLLRYVNSAFFSLPRTVGLGARGADAARHGHGPPLGHGDGARRGDRRRAGGAGRARAPARPDVRGAGRQPGSRARRRALHRRPVLVADALLDVPMEEVLETLRSATRSGRRCCATRGRRASCSSTSWNTSAASSPPRPGEAA